MRLVGGRDVGPLAETTVSWPVRRELSRILHRPRPHHAILHTHRFLNSDPIVNFDDETRIIRAEAGSLLRKVYSPLPKPSSTYQSYEGTLSRYPNSKYPRNIVNMSYYKDPASVSIGRGHLACMEYAGGRGYPRRPRFYADENRNIKDEIKFRSYYKKRATSPIAIPEALPTGFAARIFHLPLKTSTQSPYKIYKHSKSYSAIPEEKKPEQEKKRSEPQIVKNEPEIIREPSPPKTTPLVKEPKTQDIESEVTFSFKRKSPSPKEEPKVEQSKITEPVVEVESPSLNFSIKLKPRKSSGSSEGLPIENSKKEEEEETTTVVLKASSQDRDSNPPSKSSSRRSSSSAKSLKVQEEEEPTVVTMKAPSQERDSNPPSKSSSRRSSGAGRPVGQVIEEDEPTVVTIKPLSQEKKDSNPPSKSSSRRSSTKHTADEEESSVTVKIQEKEDEKSNPPSKTSSRRSSGIKKLDDSVDQKSSPGSKSRSKTPDVIVSEPNGSIPAAEAAKELAKLVEESTIPHEQTAAEDTQEQAAETGSEGVEANKTETKENSETLDAAKELPQMEGQEESVEEVKTDNV